MRLVFDIMGATEYSGGMRLHATEMIRAWAIRYPEDQVTVLGPKWAVAELSQIAKNVSVREWPNERVASRFVGQVLVAPITRWKRKADFLVSLSPIVSPLSPRRRSVCFQHDWRHIKNPDEFGFIQKQYRQLWKVSAARALTNACISEKTREETLAIVPGARTQIVSNGGDHPSRWKGLHDESESALTGCVVTFGHHNNKRPHLVIEGFAEYLRAHPATNERLVVLGARGAYQSALRDLAAQLGVESRVVFPGFVSDAEYQQIVATARCIVLASSDEGYGLPIAEADYFGLPAIATSDSGLSQIFSSLIVTDPTGEGMAAALADALSYGDDHPRKTLPTWQDSVSSLRTFLKQSRIYGE